MRRLLVAGLMAMTLGCGEVDQPSQKPMLPITRVPTAIRRAAMAKQPGVRYHTAWKLPNGSWQLKGNDLKGVSHQIQLSSQGVVLQVQ